MSNTKATKYVVGLIFICLVLIIPNVTFADEGKTEDNQIVVVSLGDSYSSGEGIEPFGLETSVPDKVKDMDWIAHRSENAWQGMLKFPGMDKSLKEYRVRSLYSVGKNGEVSFNEACEVPTNGKGAWYFVASSGATTKDMDESFQTEEEKRKEGIGQRKEYAKYDYSKSKISGAYRLWGSFNLPPQNDVIDHVKKKHRKIDYVTITIGGNDLGFADIVAKAALSATTLKEKEVLGITAVAANPLIGTSIILDANKFYKRIVDAKDAFENGTKKDKTPIRDKIRKEYEVIREKCGKDTVILVAGYPTLLDHDGKGVAFSKTEAEWINNAAAWLDYKLNELVEEYRRKEEDDRIIYIPLMETEKKENGEIVPIGGAFFGNEAEYINPIKFKIKQRVFPFVKEDIKDFIDVTRIQNAQELVFELGICKFGISPVSAYSMHPRRIAGKENIDEEGKVIEPWDGASAYAYCVQKAIDGLNGSETIAEEDVDKSYIKAVLSPFQIENNMLVLSELSDEEIANALFTLIDCGYVSVGASNLIDYQYVDTFRGGWNLVRNADFVSAAEYIYGKRIDHEDIIAAWDGMSEFRTWDEVDTSTLQSVEMKKDDLLFLPRNGRGGYYEVILDDLSMAGNRINAEYHIDYYDSNRAVYDSIQGLIAELDYTGNSRFPLQVVSISNISNDSKSTYDGTDSIINQGNKSFDLELFNRCYTSCSKPIRFLNEWDSMADLVNTGDLDIRKGYQWFYDKYKNREDSNGLILVTEEVKQDIKKLSRERGYASDWKEFLLYKDSDRTGFKGYTNKGGTTYVKCNNNTIISEGEELYTSCSRGITFLDRWESIEDVVNNGDLDMISDYSNFFNKYKTRENDDGYIVVTDEVLKDIKDLAKKRGYASDWKEFLLYAAQVVDVEEVFDEQGISKELLCNKVWEWKGFGDAIFNVEFLKDNKYRLYYKDNPSGYEIGEYEINNGVLTIEPSMKGLTPEDLAGIVPGYRYGSGDYIIQNDSLIISVEPLPSLSSTEYVTYTLSTET